MGSTALAKSLGSRGLVDEYRLMIQPVIVGGGKSIFPTNGEMRRLELIDSITTGTGVVICTYRPTED